jgi:hypothetical protein
MLKIAATNSWSGFKHSWVDNLDKNSQKKPKPKKKNGKNNNRNHKKRTVQWTILIYQPRKTILQTKIHSRF